jgi:DNA-3-methyladenine glycosylase II
MNITQGSPEEYLVNKDKLIAKLISILGVSNNINEKINFFDSLTRIIVSQQLSNSASKSILKRIEKLCGKCIFKPEILLGLDDSLLRSCGISFGKIRTIKGIANACLKKDISYSVFKNLNDEEILNKLTLYWGIGNWTAEIFMMFSLKRYDILPLGDTALQRAHSILYPKSNSLYKTAENWRPYRAIASKYLWKFIDNPQLHNLIIKNKT